ncbi:MAG: hypothetical protein HC852_24455, partial [Acaryochloridaceae cyanobacterium RU_4_10]|nr:hypothetical protein [Acaryochloridaceae cyanobacterium RU_4_10]
MTASQVLCIGELLFDYLANQSGRSLPEVESWTPYPGGAPANVATALTKLGTPSAYMGCIGRDPDGDTLTNAQEFIAGTDPQNPLSCLKVEQITAGLGACALRFTAISNRTYSVLYRES